MWPGGRKEVGSVHPCVKLCSDLLCVLLKWMRLKNINTLLLLSSKQPLFIMAYSPFAPWLYDWWVIRMLGKWAGGRWCFESVGGGYMLNRGMIIVIIYWTDSFSKSKLDCHGQSWKIKQPESTIATLTSIALCHIMLLLFYHRYSGLLLSDMYSAVERNFLLGTIKSKV